MNDLTVNQVTMTSIEIVDYINAHRKEIATAEKPFIELQHRSFMSKVSQVIGESNAANYFASQTYGNNNTRSIYNFPKREACLMAMSYSYELQAEIFDRMTAMEEALKKPLLPDFTDPAEAAIAWAEQFKAKRIAEEQLAIAAPKVDFFDRVGDSTNLINATQLGQPHGMSAQKINKILDELDVYNMKVLRGGKTFKNWFVQKGLGEMKIVETGHMQALFTTKGTQWVTAKLETLGLIK